MIEFTAVYLRCNAFNLIKILKICSDPELHPIARLTLADSALSWYPLDLHTLPSTQMQKVAKNEGWGLVKICLDISVMPPWVEFGVLE